MKNTQKICVCKIKRQIILFYEEHRKAKYFEFANTNKSIKKHFK